jgi:hypothetical protein
VKRSSILLLLTAVACSSSSRPSASPPEAQTRAVAPTPGALSRINPNIVEETDTYIIERLPKADYIRVDDRHLRHPVIGIPVEFFKEDDEYYYVITQKKIPEEESLKRELEKEGKIPAVQRERKKPESAVPLSDFTDIALTRVSGRLKLDPAAETGLPAGGMWRSSFVVADINGDGIPDIVAPSPRMGDNKLHVWLGDGKGSFSEWPLIFRQNGKPAPNFAIGYGGVAVGDIDGDGKVDVVCAWHGGGLVSLFGDGKGGFEIERTGLPAGRDFSAQAVVLLDADGDGKLDIVASRDIVESNPGQGLDYRQIRVYLYRGKKGWEFKSDGLIGGLYSNSLTAWDYDGDGRKDVLTGSHYSGGLTLIWKNAGNATFTPVLFKAIEIYAYHFASAPGTFGKSRVPAFADAYLMQTNTPESARAAGITLYAFADGEWTRHRVWRKKDGKSLLYALAMGDLDGDGLDDVVFADSEERRLRVFFQQPDGSFVEVAENEEPALDSPGQCVRLADLDGDGRLDVVLSKTITAADPRDKGGWNVYLNKVK